MKARLATALALAAVLAAGCGSAAAPAASSSPAAATPGGGAPFLATSLTATGGTWAVAVMGGSAASHNNFWQLFVRPSGSSTWKLVTPPGTADNGGLVLAGASGQLVTAFRPSQYLTFTPLTITRNNGQGWSSAGPLDAALANVPDALAAEPATGRLLALLASGAAKLAAPSYTHWDILATRRSLAATPAGRACGLGSLTAATFTAAGAPLLAGSCTRPGTAGIFTPAGRTWRAAGPALPGTLVRQPVRVLRLTRTVAGPTAVLQAGTGRSASVLAAWSADGGSRWVLSPPLSLGGAAVTTASFGPAGAATIILNGRRAQVITGADAGWRALPALPAGTAVIAPGPEGGFDALAVQRTRLTVWRLGLGSAAWRAVQVITVPIQFGSSG